MLWSFVSFFLITLVYEFVVPDPTSTYNVKVPAETCRVEQSTGAIFADGFRPWTCVRRT